ncbi:hypothetical protein GGI1_05316 [Acidithiobacillus sp. GGI-221]|nr:hypothetical protein GGI1_05316 [Acidithiobacillus sp. GGI-221]
MDAVSVGRDARIVHHLSIVLVIFVLYEIGMDDDLQ